ncbi:hypothetical protein [Flavivirga jejuensis]|uniref:DUF2219 family protein n=1 Tax=Flavivirga jejuensis TaxID=870487 RepID=A0ABT8WW09_9FLAO|nr:hypothetical protein [Flavivirga jejuensis]MDO5977081.1 hypothetical protein [Flavivirga jejuensis]
MKALISTIVISLLFIPSVFSQVTLRHSNDTIRLKLNIGKASDNTFTKSEGAEIIGTFPKNDTIKKSWQTNAYLELGIVSESSKWSIGLVGEIHRNTLIEKEQNVKQFGVNLGKIIMFRDKVTNVSNMEIPLTLSLKKSKDEIKDTNTFQGIFGLSINKFKGSSSLLKTQTQFPRISSFVGQLIGFSHNHNIGLAYLGGDEDLLLGQFDFEFNTFILPSLSDKWTDRTDFFKIQYLFKGRTRFSSGETSLDLNNYRSFQTGINLSFNKKNSIELAYAWIKGAAPLKGLANQNYETLIAKVKISIE